MRPTNSSSTGYQPGSPPDDPAQLPRFLREELLRLKAAYDALAIGHLERSYALPAKPRDGDVRYLDGSIAPGSVRGFFYYDEPTATWKPLS